jgi:hypothetical protein
MDSPSTKTTRGDGHRAAQPPSAEALELLQRLVFERNSAAEPLQPPADEPLVAELAAAGHVRVHGPFISPTAIGMSALARLAKLRSGASGAR